MIQKRVYLDGEDSHVYLDVYVANPMPEFVRKALLVIPGGGYVNVSAREGEPIAAAFMPYGYNAFVLHYSATAFSDAVFPRQLIQASKAMKHIKDHAEEYNIDPEKVFTVGFSAGGHLCGSLGTMWHLPEIYDEVEMPFGYNKPTGTMLIYPVITATTPTHMGSFLNLLGVKELTEEQVEKYSIEKQVDERSCPAFIVHTASDPAVPVRNSLLLAEAYAALGRPFELHIYPEGGHGMALANEITQVGWPGMVDREMAKWIDQAAKWAERF